MGLDYTVSVVNKKDYKDSLKYTTNNKEILKNIAELEECVFNCCPNNFKIMLFYCESEENNLFNKGIKEIDDYYNIAFYLDKTAFNKLLKKDVTDYLKEKEFFNIYNYITFVGQYINWEEDIVLFAGDY